ncbi:MAG: hypothetical protein IJ400_04670 [Clostridia bacterium]|nr:hypothetical protein [Clostridia bacterium]
MKLYIDENGQIRDTRVPKDIILDTRELSLCYTLLKDDITKGKKVSCTPFIDRCDPFVLKENRHVSHNLGATLDFSSLENGLLLELNFQNELLSQFGINLPLNFMGKKNKGGWENQFLFNSPYTSTKGDIIYTYLTKPNGANLVIALLSQASGWKMDYSPYSFGHYFVNLKILASFDKIYKVTKKPNHLRLAILPCSSFENCLSTLAKIYEKPFLKANITGGEINTKITLTSFGEIDGLLIENEDESKIVKYTPEITIENEGVTTITPLKNGHRGGDISIYGYESLVSLYKKSMDTVDLDLIKEKTDSNLCEHQCWASAMLRYLLKYKNTLTTEEINTYEEKLRTLLDTITQKNEDLAVPRITIWHKSQDKLPAYNMYKSFRVQELFFGITILLDAYKYFGEGKYYTYLIGAMDCLLDHYQGPNGEIQIDWGDKIDDYTTVCAPMIPILDVANFIKDKEPKRAFRYFTSAEKMAEHLYQRGLNFPTEGAISSEVEAEMEDGSISCTALSLLYFCKNYKRNESYIKKAKEILDIHESWVINSPSCHTQGSSLRWWETQWEGDSDGPAICAGHAWSIWRGEADYLYYELTNDKEYLTKATNTFITNLSKIDKNGHSYAIFNPDYINGGGFTSNCQEVNFRIAQGFPQTKDSGLSRYVWIRINDTFLQ